MLLLAFQEKQEILTEEERGQANIKTMQSVRRTKLRDTAKEDHAKKNWNINRDYNTGTQQQHQQEVLSGNSQKSLTFPVISFDTSSRRPNSCPNLAAVRTQSPRPVIPSLSLLTAMILSLQLQSLKAAHAQSAEDTSVTTVTLMHS